MAIKTLIPILDFQIKFLCAIINTTALIAVIQGGQTYLTSANVSIQMQSHFYLQR